MPVFTVIATREPEKVKKSIEEKFPASKRYAVRPEDAFMIAFDGTSRELAEMLGLRSGENGTGVVLLVQNYSGRASPDLWEWLKLNWPGNPSDYQG